MRGILPVVVIPFTFVKLNKISSNEVNGVRLSGALSQLASDCQGSLINHPCQAVSQRERLELSESCTGIFMPPRALKPTLGRPYHLTTEG